MANTIDFNKRVEQFVELRDEIKRIEDEQKKQLAPYKETLEQLNSVLLAHLNDVGADSVSSAAGTVYRKERKSASIADKTAFWAWVVANADWDLIDVKANATAVEEFAEKNGSLPPGVNFTAKHDVGVRRK
jgi:hypothetical protein